MTYHLVCALAAADRGRRRALAQPQAEAGGPRGRSSWGLRLAAPPRSVLRAPWRRVRCALVASVDGDCGRRVCVI